MCYFYCVVNILQKSSFFNSENLILRVAFCIDGMRNSFSKIDNYHRYFQLFVFLCYMMSPLTITFIIVIYFSILILISKITSKNSSDEAFFVGERKSPWYIVTYGMIGATLSGITFLSVPGWVAETEFFYMQMVLGYVRLFICCLCAFAIYYQMKLYSIYGYLQDRFGYYSHKCGAGYFFLSDY